MHKARFLSGNMLKLIAAAAMLCDHIGLVFFPQITILRIIGRLAFPVFAFMIAEGCRYTRNKLRYFLTIAISAVIFQIAYFIDLKSLDLCIFATFSFSILIIYTLQHFKKVLFDSTASVGAKIFSFLLFLGVTLSIYTLNLFVKMDYGFWGCMVPVFASLLHSNESSPKLLKKIDMLTVNVLVMGIGLLLLAMFNSTRQYFSLLTIPLLLLYSGKRGTKKLKYFFYIFYPAHLLIIYAIYLLIK